VLDFQTLRLTHPCFAGGQSNQKGRIHLPVCPGCNIHCRFCLRKLCDDEVRPGVASELLTPEEASDAVERALTLCPELTVVGIAGPGDTLASPQALETFRLVGERYPYMIKCMSTNGLLLPDKVQEILDVGIDTLTVTVNAVDPTIQAQICGEIFYHGKTYTGEVAATILIHNQLEGIYQVASGGVTVKVNTVLIPGINDSHIATVARTVAAVGASLYNIIPLIPQHELKDVPAPTCTQIDTARTAARPYIEVFEHCQRCRADAVGQLGGTDYSKQVFTRRLHLADTFSHG
jgi:nitrogen fixation protein NifB